MCRADLPARRSSPDLELADIVRAHASDVNGLTSRQSQALTAIASCRTAALGGHISSCDSCGFTQTVYNSCRDRHCPKCQGAAQQAWVDKHLQDVLPVPYFHIVFTIADALHPLFLAGQAVAYNLLFAAAARTLEEVAANPRRLGARIGFVAVLHTWTQTLLYHPHIHVLVPGGGLSPDGASWRESRSGYFLPVRVLSEVFRGKLLAELERAVQTRAIRFDEADARRALKRAARSKWNVYAKPPFGGPEAVIKYLGRYTHRIAISNSRLLDFSNDHVTFAYRDRAAGNERKTLTLPTREFLRRFLLHVLPRGFQRLRHYGFLANPVRRSALALCRAHLNAKPPKAAPANREPKSDPRPTCPRCHKGHLELRETVPASRRWQRPGKETSPP